MTFLSFWTYPLPSCLAPPNEIFLDAFYTMLSRLFGLTCRFVSLLIVILYYSSDSGKILGPIYQKSFYILYIGLVEKLVFDDNAIDLDAWSTFSYLTLFHRAHQSHASKKLHLPNVPSLLSRWWTLQHLSQRFTS